MSPIQPTDEDEDGGATIRFARGFTYIPNGVIAADISTTAFKVYCAIRSYGRGAEPSAFPKRETVCDAFGISPRSFSAGIKELQDRGFLVVSKRSYAGGMRRANTYFFPDVDDSQILPVQGADFAPSSGADLAPSLDALFARPEEEDLSTKNTHEKNTRAVAIPTGWHPAESTLLWAKEKYPGIDAVHEVSKFIDHHQSKGTKFKDAEAGFRTWMHNAAKWNPQPTAQQRLAAVPNNQPSQAFAKEMGWA